MADTAARRTVHADDGCPIQVVEFGGTGEPILLLHGLMGRATTWWPVARWLSGHGRVLGMDARGHGRSGARGPWTAERMARDVVDVLESVGGGVVVGHSMGGLHGLLVAAPRPELVRALVVEDMAVDFRDRSIDPARAWYSAIPQPFASLAAVRDSFGHPYPEFGEYMAECVEERDDGYHLLVEIDHVVEIAAEWARRSFWSVLQVVRCPVLLIEAEESVAPPGQIAQMAQRLPTARHVVLPGTGHLAHAGDPDGYREQVSAFVREAQR